MIRQVRTDDATAIASIYNGYVTGSNITFEEEPVTVEEMTSRIAGIRRVSRTLSGWRTVR